MHTQPFYLIFISRQQDIKGTQCKGLYLEMSPAYDEVVKIEKKPYIVLTKFLLDAVSTFAADSLRILIRSERIDGPVYALFMARIAVCLNLMYNILHVLKFC